MLIGIVKWFAGVTAFVAISAVSAHYFVTGMQAWARAHGCSVGFVLELQLLRPPVFAVCILSGALYASALAKPGGFGGVARIWRHLASTFILWLFGCALTVRAEFLPLPDFTSHSGLNAYLFTAFGLSFGCFATGLLSWALLAFGRGRASKGRFPNLQN